MNHIPPHAGEADAPIAVKVWFFGMMRSLTGARELLLDLPAGSRVAEVMAALSERYGEKFTAQILRDPHNPFTFCRISVNGRLINTLDAPLTVFDGGATVEMILLACQEGG